MDRRFAAAALAVLCTGVLAGCASASSGPAPGGDVSATSGEPGPTPTGPYQLPSPKASGQPTPQAGEQTLTGRIEAGVEHGCLVMHVGGRTYNLISGDPQIVHEGAQVVITGHIATGIMTYCQQGVPFQVTSARSG